MSEDDAAPTRAVATRVPAKLYAFLEEEQARLAESGIRLPISGVVRMMLERAHRAVVEEQLTQQRLGPPLTKRKAK